MFLNTFEKEQLAGLLEQIHFDGTGCGTTGSNGCSNCHGPSPMSALEIVDFLFGSSVVTRQMLGLRARSLAEGWDTGMDAAYTGNIRGGNPYRGQASEYEKTRTGWSTP